MPDAIRLDDVRMRFGDRIAVDELSLAVPRGAVYGVIGPNGSGKTTIRRLLLDRLRPDAGRVEVLGETQLARVRDRVGYLPEERGLYRRMTVRTTLQYLGLLKGATLASLRPRIASWLERVQLAELADRRVDVLSKGMAQKLQLVAAVIAEPELLVLDEPLSGLDRERRAGRRRAGRAAGPGRGTGRRPGTARCAGARARHARAARPAPEGRDRLALEEKANRVSEILVSSISPFELMLGKLLGGLAACGIAAFAYAGTLLAALVLAFGAAVPIGLLALFVVCLVLSLLLWGALYLALGAACTDMKDAQNLMLPLALLARPGAFGLVPRARALAANRLSACANPGVAGARGGARVPSKGRSRRSRPGPATGRGAAALGARGRCWHAACFLLAHRDGSEESQMKSLFRFATAACFAALLGSPVTASSFGDGTLDEAPPAEESVCEDAGYAGAALGLCVAFCEANDCDVESGGAACDRLRANYTRITGDLAFPCELPDHDEPR